MGIKPKPIVFWPHAFSRAWPQLHVFASNSDWFIALFTSVAFGQSISFGFGFTALNWKPLYKTLNKINLRISSTEPCLQPPISRGNGMLEVVCYVVPAKDYLLYLLDKRFLYRRCVSLCIVIYLDFHSTKRAL